MSIPLGPLVVLGAMVFMAVADRPSRRHWFTVGVVIFVVAWALPLVLGFSRISLIAALMVFVISAQFSGEAIY